MKRCVSAICLLLIMGSLAFGIQKPNDWIKYSSLEGHYSVMLPSQPELGTQESATANGVKFTQYKATVEAGGTVYLVGYFDHLPGTDFSFERARAGMLEAMNGTVVSESKLTLAANPGLELKLAIKDDQGNEYLVQARFYDVDKRVYMLQFIYPKTNSPADMNAAAAKYFDSFQLLPN
jgi:hypothetical protein